MPRKKINSPAPPPNYPDYNNAGKAQKWMWTGIISFSATILFLWIWSMKIRLDFFSWNKTPEYAIAAKTKNDWNKIFEENARKESNLENAKARLKNILSAIVASSSVPTTTVASSTAKASSTLVTGTASTVKMK